MQAINPCWSNFLAAKGSTVFFGKPGTEIANLRRKDIAGCVTSLALAPNGDYSATSSLPGIIHLYKTADGSLERILTCGDARITSLAFSADGKWLACGSHDGVIRLWRASDGTMQAFELNSDNSVRALAFSPCSNLLAVASDDKSIRLWAVTSFGLLRFHEPVRLCAKPNQLAFSPDGCSLAVLGENGNIQFCQTRTGISMMKQSLSGNFTGVAFSPNGAQALTSAKDGAINLWRMADGERVAVLRQPNPRAPALIPEHAFSPDGNHIFWMEETGAVCVMGLV